MSKYIVVVTQISNNYIGSLGIQKSYFLVSLESEHVTHLKLHVCVTCLDDG